GLGGTNSAHDALEAGEVDIIWDYIGTILSESHDVPAASLPTDVGTGLAMVSALDARYYNLTWMQPTSFNDTYTLMIKPGTIVDNLTSMEDLATFMNENEAPVTLCVENEFYSRGDGLANLQAHYGFEFPEENIEIVAYEQLYIGLRDGLCDVAEGFSTDGRISAYGFQNLVDSLSFFPNYSASPIIRSELLAQFPELEVVLNRLGAALDDTTMTELNARVDLGLDGVVSSGDEEAIEAVALDFLDSHGLLGNRPQITVLSQDLTEQLILGQILVQVLQDAGFDVIDRTGLAGTNAAHDALTSGEVDVIWGYIGTVLSESHGVPLAGLPTNVYDGYDMVSALDKRHNDVVWLTPSAFNNTYTLMIKSGNVTDGLTSMAGLADFMQNSNTPLRLCVENEFYRRGDGLANLQSHYNLTFAEADI
ncbi:MAG: hypothetical protein KAG66_19980, partial [Methylococcales bacterium]|nr:hypothetical protein [Methylococcales bacterium]